MSLDCGLGTMTTTTFPRNQDLTFHANCLHRKEKISSICQKLNKSILLPVGVSKETAGREANNATIIKVCIHSDQIQYAF